MENNLSNFNVSFHLFFPVPPGHRWLAGWFRQASAKPGAGKPEPVSKPKQQLGYSRLSSRSTEKWGDWPKDSLQLSSRVSFKLRYGNPSSGFFYSIRHPWIWDKVQRLWIWLAPRAWWKQEARTKGQRSWNTVMCQTSNIQHRPQWKQAMKNENLETHFLLPSMLKIPCLCVVFFWLWLRTS